MRTNVIPNAVLKEKSLFFYLVANMLSYDIYSILYGSHEASPGDKNMGSACTMTSLHIFFLSVILFSISLASSDSYTLLSLVLLVSSNSLFVPSAFRLCLIPPSSFPLCSIFLFFLVRQLL